MSQRDRVTPHNLEAEKAVIGAVLVDPRLWLEVETLPPAAFFRDAHQRIWSKMAAIAQRGKTIDLLTVTDELGRAGELEDCGGPAYIASLTDGVPRASNISGYADIVRKNADLRRLIQAGSHLLERARDPDAEPEQVLDDAERILLDLHETRAARVDGFLSASDLVTESWSYLEQLADRKGGLAGISTGWPDLDNVTRGWQAGNLIVVAGRPSMGKSALALQTAFSAAKAGKRVGLFSLEMSRQELLVRLVSMEGQIDSHRLQSGYARDVDLSRMSTALGSIHESLLWIDDSAALSTLEMRRRARRQHRKHGLDLIVVDYLQLMKGDRRTENRQQEVSGISQGLKALAKELRIPVIALSQLSRGPESRHEGKPMLSDLRESGSIEQDSDVVILMYRPEYYKPDDPSLKGVAEAIVAKSRTGPVGTVPLTWRAEFTRFESANYQRVA